MENVSKSIARLNKLFFGLLLITLIIRFLLSAFIPFTGDEAYFYIWGKYPSLGYYDHTPLVGWLLYLLLLISKSEIILRLPATILPAFIAVGLYLTLRKYDNYKALLLSILFLLTPVNLCLNLISTDVPLVYFSFLSGIFLFLAIKKQDHLGYYLLSGLCLGLAFLSKYFAVLLALAYVIYFLTAEKNGKRCLGFLLVFICVIPFGLLNLYWNYTHAWANILFNIFNRNHNAGFHWLDILTYLVFLTYIVTPIVAYYLLKNYKNLFTKKTYQEFNLVPFLFIVPLGFYLLLSIIKSVGFHWLLSFIPFIYLGAIYYLTDDELIRSIKFMIWYTAIHLVIIVILLIMPLSAWHYFGFKGERYAEVVYFFKHKEVRDYLNNYNQQFIFTSHSYADADLMFYDSNQYSPSYGYGSVHGREGDLLTDFRNMAHKNFLLIDTSPPDLSFISPYFTSFQVKSFTIYGATFYYVLAYNFNYEKYRDRFLSSIYQWYWQIPHYLPHKGNFYCQKYFTDQNCN